MGLKKEDIAKAVTGVLEERKCFLVDVSVSAANDIEIVIEREEGAVDWDDCTAVDKAVHEAFNQDEEDYSTTVSSAGLDRPFKVLKQYRKALGSLVDVKFKGGKRLRATLTAATQESIRLSFTVLESVEGHKKKQSVLHEETFALADINSVTPSLDFK